VVPHFVPYNYSWELMVLWLESKDDLCRGRYLIGLSY
jgi:hypothetical protein